MQALASRRSATVCGLRQQQQRSNSSNSSSSIRADVAQRRVVAPVGCRRPHRSSAMPLVVRASAVAPRSPNEEGYGQQEQGAGGFSPMMSVPNVTMSGPNYGSGGSLGATLERSRLSFVMPTPVVKGPKLDDGGDGGDIGKNNRHGGGGGGGDDDDDEFGFGEDDDGEGGGQGREWQGLGLFRAAIPASYDKFSVGAVLAEWMKTIQELPAILRQAVTMGLFSSAQLVRFFSMDVRPSVTRTISRALPPSLAREFIGRLMADPGFLQKLVLETSFASAASLWYEARLRGDKLKEEADLAAINTLGMAAATAATVWLLAPSRSYGSIQKFPWQQMLDGLPNCVFDASGPLRQYSKQARAMGFLAKMAELSAVGALMGSVTSALSTVAVAARRRANPEWNPSTEVPNLGRSSAGLAAFFAVNANTRYQLIGGLDRFLFDRTTFLWTYVAASGAARLASNQIGELSRAWWQGLPAPATLAPGPALPALMLPRRVKKKVAKRVPRSQARGSAAQQPPAAAAAAVAAGSSVGYDGVSLTDSVVPLDTTLGPAQAPASVASSVVSHPLADGLAQEPVSAAPTPPQQGSSGAHSGEGGGLQGGPSAPVMQQQQPRMAAGAQQQGPVSGASVIDTTARHPPALAAAAAQQLAHTDSEGETSSEAETSSEMSSEPTQGMPRMAGRV